MKFSFLLFLFISLLSTAAFAQSSNGADFLNPSKKTKQPTPAQMDESFALYDQCDASDMIRKYYSCDCLAAKFLELRVAKPQDPRDNLVTAARKKCPNTVDIAGASYQRCLSWAPQVRNDYNEYCACYANTFAKSFSKTPTDSIRVREAVMTNALNVCNKGDQVAQNRARQKLINQLKKQGVYETLFPNAKKDSSEEPAQSPN